MVENSKMKEEVVLPSELIVGKFASARIKEIEAMTSILSQPKQGQLASQQVPRHMRRRAVSHNPNRLPRRLRARHLIERSKSGGNSRNPSKRPSRKYRRRPGNLLKEYNRRQRSTVWMETHIWHAKRFHVTSKWGYKLPQASNEKNFRACFRAIRDKCLMQDISYHGLFELIGNETDLLNIFSELKQSDLTGEEERTLPIYHPGLQPRGFIGDISVLWRPPPKADVKSRTLWIWFHPSISSEFFDLLKSIFKFRAIEKEEKKTSRLEDSSTVNLGKLAPRNIPYERTPKYVSEINSDVRLIDLTNTMNRFRLIGPHSRRILSKTLQRSSLLLSDDEMKGKKWWKNATDNKINWSSNVTHCIVRDPRVILPQKRGVVISNDESEDENLDKNESCSPLWDSEVRDAVSLSKCSDHEINVRRSELLVPGSQLPLTEDESRVPVLLVRISSTKDEFGSGWDIISPAGWGMAFWLNFVLYGARVGGLRETESLNFEKGQLAPPIKDPDSEAGASEMELQANLLKEIYLRYPPDKRCNYAKMGVASPFVPPWRVLIRDWINFSEPLVQVSKRKKMSLTSEVNEKQFYVIRRRRSLSDKTEGDEKFGLIPVKVEILGKGTLSANSMICIPSSGDLELLKEEKFEGENFELLTEPVHKDENEALRKKLREEHSLKKLALRRKWKKIKAKLVGLKHNHSKEEVIKSLSEALKDIESRRKSEIEKYNEEMNSLWLGEFNTIKDSCSRPIMGFVVKGEFSLRFGKSIGLGFVASLSLKHLSNEKKIVLTREPSSHQFRFAQLSLNS